MMVCELLFTSNCNGGTDVGSSPTMFNFMFIVDELA